MNKGNMRFSMSANEVFDLANWILIVCLIGGVVATWALVSAGKIKEVESAEEIARMGSEAARANERAASLEKEAAQARLETQQLKKLMAWRRITSDQAAKIADALRGKLHSAIRLVTLISDPEANQFFSDITSTFQMAGITPSFYSGLEQATGFWITNGNTEDGQRIKSAFSSIGLTLSDRPDGAFGLTPKGTIEIIVGSKPPNFFTSENEPAKVDWHTEAIISRSQ